MPLMTELARTVENDPALEQRMRANPAEALRSMPRPLESDPWIYRGVVGALGGTLLIVVAASAVLSFYGHQVPDVLTALGSAAVGAMAGLLAPSPSR